MDFSLLNNSSEVTPMLVKLYDSQKLYGIAKNRTPEARMELVEAVCELLDVDLTLRESELIADVMIEVMRQAEFDLRQALAEKLAAMDNVPFRLALHIANDEIGVAAPVLRQSKVLGDLDLIYIVKSKTPEYWCEIAARKSLNDKLINLLAETRDFDTAMVLVQNEDITLTNLSLGILSDVAQGKDVLAAPLLKREEMTDEFAANLYEFVGEQIKSYMREHYTIEEQNIVTKAIDDIVSEEANAEESEVTAEIYEAQKIGEKTLYAPETITIERLIEALKRGQIDAFMKQFAAYAGLDVESLNDMIARNNGQGLAILCKAHGVLKTDFISLFLLTNSLRNEGETVDIAVMNRAVNYYDKITEDMARSVLNGSLHTH